MKYVVKIGYKDFDFYNATEAVNFAEAAVRHYKKDDDSDRDLSVTIEVVVDTKED